MGSCVSLEGAGGPPPAATAPVPVQGPSPLPATFTTPPLRAITPMGREALRRQAEAQLVQAANRVEPPAGLVAGANGHYIFIQNRGILDLEQHGVLDKIFKHLTVQDKLQNVQLACKSFRRVLQNPQPGTWGALHLTRPTNLTFRERHQVNLWLRPRVTGIDSLTITTDSSAAVEVNRTQQINAVSMLYSILAGRDLECLKLHLTLPLNFNMGADSDSFSPVLLRSTDEEISKMASQLTSLQTPTTAAALPIIVQLTSLRHLHLTVHESNAGDARMWPHNCSLPSLTYMWLGGCTTGVRQLLSGAQLPRLTHLVVDACLLADGDLNAITRITSLRDLKVQRCVTLNALPPLAALTELEALDLTGTVGPLSKPGPALRGLQALRELRLLEGIRLNSELVQAIKDMKTLKLVVMDDQDRDPDPALAFCISKLYALLEGRGGHFEMET